VRLLLTVARANIGLLKKQYSARDGKRQDFFAGSNPMIRSEEISMGLKGLRVTPSGWRTPNPSPLIRLLDLPQSVRIDRLNLVFSCADQHRMILCKIACTRTRCPPKRRQVTSVPVILHLKKGRVSPVRPRCRSTFCPCRC
jgi:hypothetical protein